MIQGQSQSEPDAQPQVYRSTRSYLLRRYPVLLPAFMTGGAILLCASSFYTSISFPMLALFGTSSAQLCISLAIVLGIGGLLTAIVGLIERFDQPQIQTQTGALPTPKEQSYANRH